MTVRQPPQEGRCQGQAMGVAVRTPQPREPEQSYLEFPADYDELSAAGQLAVCGALATRIQQSLGITPDDGSVEDRK